MMENINLDNDDRLSSIGILERDKREFIKLKMDYETKAKKEISQIDFFSLLLEIYRNNGGEI